MKEEEYLEKAIKVQKWMKSNFNNEWVQRTGTIWLNYMMRISNESA